MRPLTFVLAGLTACLFMGGCSGFESATKTVYIVVTATPRAAHLPTSPPASSPSAAATAQAKVPTVVRSVTPSAAMLVHGFLSLPKGKPRGISQVAWNPYDATDVAMVLRNNTGAPVHHIGVAMQARDPSGKLIATGSSLDVEPNSVQPGELVLVHVYFQGANLPANASYTSNGSWQLGASDQYENVVDLSVTEGNVSNGNLVGIVSDQTGNGAKGPIQVVALCFSNSGQLLTEHDGFTDGDAVSPGGNTSFTLDLSQDTCPKFMIAASGFSQ